MIFKRKQAIKVLAFLSSSSSSFSKSINLCALCCAVLWCGVDYYIVYAQPASSLYGLHTTSASLDSHSASFIRDKSLVSEYTAMEAATFISELLKGNPRNLEPLFCDRCIYQVSSMWLISSLNREPCIQSPLWRALKSSRRGLLSERAVSQYFGFVMDRITQTTSQKVADNKTQHKSLYHVTLNRQLRSLLTGFVAVFTVFRRFISYSTRSGWLRVRNLAFNQQARSATLYCEFDRPLRKRKAKVDRRRVP